MEEGKKEKGALATPSCDPGLKAKGFVYRPIHLWDKTDEEEVDEFSEMLAHEKSFWEKVVRAVIFNLTTSSDLARFCITGGALFTGCTFTRRHRSTMINYLIIDTQRSEPGACCAVLSLWFPTLHGFLLADSQIPAVCSSGLAVINVN